MKKQIKLQLSLFAATAAFVACLAPAGAQVDYYHSPAYQAEEQAFRARQNQGAALYEQFGANSAPYANWYLQNKGVPLNTNPYGLYSPYMPYTGSFYYGY